MISPNHRLNRRGSACFRAWREKGFALKWKCFNCFSAGRDYVPTNIRPAHHFRTPSPSGQLDHFSTKLPANLFATIALIQQGFAGTQAQRSLSLISDMLMFVVEADKKPEQQGSDKCVSKHGSLPQPRVRDWRHAGTHSKNKRWSARAQARPQPLCWTESRSQARFSGRRAICYIARPTPASAADTGRAPLPLNQTPPIKRRGIHTCKTPAQADGLCAGVLRA